MCYNAFYNCMDNANLSLLWIKISGNDSFAFVFFIIYFVIFCRLHSIKCSKQTWQNQELLDRGIMSSERRRKTRRHTFKNDVIKKEKENYSKLTKRNIKLRSLGQNKKKESSDRGNITNTSHKYFIFRVSYSSRQSLGKAVVHTIRTLPKIPGKKKQVLSKIVSTLSPHALKLQYLHLFRESLQLL